jgi:hypothetical protein
VHKCALQYAYLVTKRLSVYLCLYICSFPVIKAEDRQTALCLAGMHRYFACLHVSIADLWIRKWFLRSVTVEPIYCIEH